MLVKGAQIYLGDELELESIWDRTISGDLVDNPSRPCDAFMRYFMGWPKGQVLAYHKFISNQCGLNRNCTIRKVAKINMIPIVKKIAFENVIYKISALFFAGGGGGGGYVKCHEGKTAISFYIYQMS